MIKSFRSKEAEQLHARQRVKRFRAIERVAQRKLRQLDIATELRDLASLQATIWKPSRATERGSTVSASTISGVFALSGAMGMLTAWRLWIITRGNLPSLKRRRRFT